MKNPPDADGDGIMEMTWAVYKCDKIERWQPPQNEQFVSGHGTPIEAMKAANELKRSDRENSYVVGAA